MVESGEVKRGRDKSSESEMKRHERTRYRERRRGYSEVSGDGVGGRAADGGGTRLRGEEVELSNEETLNGSHIGDDLGGGVRR